MHLEVISQLLMCGTDAAITRVVCANGLEIEFYPNLTRAQTKTKFATIRLSETQKDIEFSKQQTLNSKQQTAHGKQQTANKEEYLAKYLANICQITKIFGGLL